MVCCEGSFRLFLIINSKKFCNDIAILHYQGVTLFANLCLIAMPNNAVNIQRTIKVSLKEKE
ncbi:MAG: hypothetical protein RL275_3407 [Chloroflexota bacterium]|jgi:hypothetical protein